MPNSLFSVEGARLVLSLLGSAFLLAAGACFYPWQASALLALFLAAGAALLFFVAHGPLKVVMEVLRANAATADAIAADDFSVNFAAKGSGSLEKAQASLAGMLSKLKRDLSLSRGIVASMATPFAVADLEENLIGGNPELIDMVEHSGRPDDFYGQNIGYFFYGDKRTTVLNTAMRENKTIRKEVEFTGRKGRKLNIHIDASPLYDLQKRLMGSLCVYTNLTELREREKEILSQKAVIDQAVQAVNEVSLQLHATAQDLATQVKLAIDNACAQANQALEAEKSMGEMNAAVFEIAKGAAAASTHAEEAQNKASQGATIVKNAIAAITDVHNLAASLKDKLHGLGRLTESVGRIMDVISDIADQTNLLALNAAIEAARAGDAGRGFAVVADEVRKLAEKTVRATQEVGEAITSIQGDTRSSLEGMDRAAGAVEKASGLAASSGDALREIVALVDQTSSKIGAIASAAEEQSSATSEISKSVENVRLTCDETSGELGRAAHCVEELTRLSGALRDIMRMDRA